PSPSHWAHLAAWRGVEAVSDAVHGHRAVDAGHQLHLSPHVVELVVADRPGSRLRREQPGREAGVASLRQVAPVPADQLERARLQRNHRRCLLSWVHWAEHVLVAAGVMTAYEAINNDHLACHP